MDASRGHPPGAASATVEIEQHGGRGPWIIEIGDAGDVRRFPVPVKRALTIGSGPRAQVRVADVTVSALHCVVEGVEAGLEVRDLGSKNGVFVGGARVLTATLKQAGAAFVIGRTSVVVRCDEGRGRAKALTYAKLRGEAVDAESIAGLVGNSRAMRRLRADIARIAPLRAPVLVLGESGTGKDLVARALHDHGRRAGPYVPVNVAAFVDSLLDAELFGHRRGAFTGALSNRPGAFEQAHRGTLFLDEIADLSPAAQAKLLRVVEDGCVRPIGATEPEVVDVRIVSATWADLHERANEGRFRLDLFHRLSTLMIRIAPLRNRKEDIPALSQTLLARMADEVGYKTISAAALDKLVSYRWPGNVRELRSVLYRAAVSTSRAEIASVDIDLPRGGSDAEPARVTPLLPERVLDLLQEHDGNVSAAARAAGVARSTYRAWLDRARRG